MRSFGTYDTKNRLSELLDAVEKRAKRSRSFDVVKPVARLVPIPRENARFASSDEAVEWLQQNRIELPTGTLRKLINEGRR